MSELPPPRTAPAGWYHDPWRPNTLRYFDGRVWSQADAVPPPAVSARSVVSSAPYSQPIVVPTLPLRAAVGAIAVLVASLVLARVLLDVLLVFEWPVGVYIAFVAAVGYGPAVVWCWWAAGRWGTASRRHTLGLVPSWSDLGWGPLIWFVAIVAQIIVGALLVIFDVPSGSNIEDVSEIGSDSTYIAVVLLSAVVMAPLVEEILFRGLVLRGLMSVMAAPWAVVMQAVAFGALHVDPALGTANIGLVLVLSIVGVVLGTGAYLLRRITPSIVAHAIFNAVVLAIVLSGIVDRLE